MFLTHLCQVSMLLAGLVSPTLLNLSYSALHLWEPQVRAEDWMEQNPATKSYRNPTKFFLFK